MPKRASELSAIQIRQAKHSGKGERAEVMAVGGVSGLMLQVTRSGAKCWILRIRTGGRRREMGLGAFPEVSLSDARDKAGGIKAKLAVGVDPLAERRVAQAAIAAAEHRGMTFTAAYEKWMKAKADDFPTDKKRRYVAGTFTRYARPKIGPMDVQDIRTQDVARVLAPIWKDKHETASKLRQRIEAVLSWATVAGHRQGDNPARWAGNLKELLPRREAVTSTAHQPAISMTDAPAWWAALAARGGMGAQALQFATMTAARSGQVRGATWGEIDLDAALWTIPADRMKARRDHRVPLPAAAVDLLKRLPRIDGTDLVFPAPRGGPLSDMTIGKVMRDMQEDAVKAGGRGWLDAATGRPAVPHGIRSTFRDWCAERGIDDNVAELALAHQVGSAVERAYLRSDMIERRRAVMDEWAAFLGGRDQRAVVAFPRRASGPAA